MRHRTLAASALLTLACASPALVHGAGPMTTIPASQLVLADSAESRPLTHQFPLYPFALQAQGVTARFVAYFVVDTAGRVDIHSVRFGLDADRAFYEAVCTALGRTRFTPIRREGQPRAALVVQPYSFSIGSPPEFVSNAESYRQAIRQAGMDSTLVTLSRRPRC